VIIRPASSLAHDRESSPADTSVLPTLLRRQILCTCDKPEQSLEYVVSTSILIIVTCEATDNYS